MIKQILILISAILIFTTACKETNKQEDQQVKMEDVFDKMSKQTVPSEEQATVSLNAGTVVQTKNTDRYTYVELEGDDKKRFWIAIEKFPVFEGETLVFESGMIQENFESKEFDMVFDTLYLVSKFRRLNKKGPDTFNTPEVKDLSQANVNQKPRGDSGSKTSTGSEVSIDDLFHHTSSYENKEVLVRGKVTKVNENIMGKNWIHLIDPADGHGHDLTITSSEQVRVGEMYTFKGKISLNKDFGAGYTYDLIMEDAKVQK